MADYCRFSSLPTMFLTRFDLCYEQPEESYTHGATCSYSCGQDGFISDRLARANNLPHGLAYIPPDDNLQSELINATTPAMGTDIKGDYKAVGKIQCQCGEYELAGSGDGEGSGAPWSATLCNWVFLEDSWGTPNSYSVCGHNFIEDTKRAVSYHSANNTLLNQVLNDTYTELVDMITPYGEKVLNDSTTTYPAFYDSVHAFNFTKYVGYGEINIYCENGVSICLDPDLFFPHAETDTVQRELCAELTTNITEILDEYRLEREYEIQNATLLEFTTLETDVRQNISDTWDLFNTTWGDSDYVKTNVCVNESICADETNFKDTWNTYVTDQIAAKKSELETEIALDQAAIAIAAVTKLSHVKTDINNMKDDVIGGMLSRENVRINTAAANVLENLTDYTHYEFHKPELRMDRRMFNILDDVLDYGRSAFTFKHSTTQDDTSISRETRFTSTVAETLRLLGNKVDRRIEESENFFKRHNQEELTSMEELVCKEITHSKEKLLVDKDRDRETAVAQSASTSRATSGGLTKTASVAILGIMKNGATKTARVKGNVLREMQRLKDESRQALLGANVEYAKQLGDKKVELAQYLSDKVSTIRAEITTMKSALQTKMADQETTLLAKIALTEEITSNQLKVVVDTIADHFEGNTNMTGINFDPTQYYMFQDS